MPAKFLGTSDEVTTCECCGRANLKSTVAIALDDCGEAVYFGVTCAAKAIGGGVTTKDVKIATAAADRTKADAKRAELARIHALEDAAWQTFLDARAPEFARSFMGGPDRFRQLTALGGYAAARAAFKAAA